ncbi:MAG: VOC family protein [Undibacterium sp.]|nr:VOC family protein [Undibacterium sp.]
MFSHITVGSNDLEKSEKFYNAVLLPLGLIQREVEPDGSPPALCWTIPNQVMPRFFVYSPFNRGLANSGNGSMVAFIAPSIAAVNAAFAAALAAGGSSEGDPAERAHYAKNYYGAYLRDPDGNKVHITYRGDLV